MKIRLEGTKVKFSGAECNSNACLIKYEGEIHIKIVVYQNFDLSVLR